MVSDYSTVDRGFASQLLHSLDKCGLQIAEMPFFCTDEKSSDGISSAVGNYVNYLRVGELVILPTYGVRNDERAARVLEKMLPDCHIRLVRCDDLAHEGGVLNCVSWTVGV